MKIKQILHIKDLILQFLLQFTHAVL